jgi:hypothetical protein
VLTLAALLAIPLLAVPASAAPPVTAITSVTVTGTTTAAALAEGTGDCVWRMEVTIENFHGGGKTIYASLGSPTRSYLVTPPTDVRGKVTNFVWETTAPLTYFPAVANWVVHIDNNKGLQATMINPVADIVCGT